MINMLEMIEEYSDIEIDRRENSSISGFLLTFPDDKQMIFVEKTQGRLGDCLVCCLENPAKKDIDNFRKGKLWEIWTLDNVEEARIY